MAEYEDFDDDFDLDFGNLDSGLDEKGDFDIDSNDPKPKGRKPLEEVGTGIGDAVKGISLTEPPFKENLVDAFPKTNKLFQGLTDASMTKHQITSEATRELGPAVNQLKMAGRRVLPKVKGLLPERVYDKIYNKLEPKKQFDRTSLEEERENIIVQQLQAMNAAENEQEQENLLRERTDKYIQDAIDRGEHTDTMSTMNSIKAYQFAQTKFLTISLKGYLAKSLELKYRHMFIAKDTLDLTKSLVGSLENKLEGILHNTSLPDIQKKRNVESLKEAQRELIIGKGMDTVGEWSRGFRQNLMKNVRNKASEYIGNVKMGMESVSDMANQYMDVEEMSAEFADEDEKRSGLATGSKFVAGAGLSLLMRKLTESAIKAAGQHGVDMENFSESFGEKIKYNINDALESKSGGLWEIIKEIVPTLDKERGGITKNLDENAFEEVEWNVLDHRALVDIIPGYMAEQTKFLEDIATGRNDSELKVFDPVKEKFFKESEFKSEIQKRHFGTKEERTEEIQDTIGNLLGAYKLQGGDEKVFEENINDLVKFINSSAKHAKNIDFKKITKLASGEEIEDSDERERLNDYLDDIMTDVKDRESILNILDTAFKDKRGRENRDVTISLDSDIKKISRQRDERLEEMHKSTGFGTSRYYSDILKDDGNLDHEKAREIYADVNTPSIIKDMKETAKRRATKLTEIDNERFFTDSRYDARNIEEASEEDKQSEKNIERRNKRLQASLDKLDEIVKIVEEGGLSALRNRNIKEELEESLQTIQEDEELSLSKQIIKDTPHISGPGIYMQGSDEELHIPLDKMDNLWGSLGESLNKSNIHDKLIDSIENTIVDFMTAVGDDTQLTHEYLDLIHSTLTDVKSSTMAISTMQFPNMDFQELFSFKDNLEKPGIFKRIFKKGMKLGGWGLDKGFNILDKSVDFGIDAAFGTANVTRKLLGSGTTMIGDVGTTLSGVTSGVAQRFSNKIPKYLEDLYLKDSNEVLVTKQQLKNAVFEDGTKVRNIATIDSPVLDKKTGKVLITKEHIKHGITTKQKTSLEKIKEDAKIQVKESNELTKEGPGLIKKGLSKAIDTAGSLAKLPINIANQLNTHGLPIGMKMASMGLTGIGEAGKFGIDFLRDKFIGGGSDKLTTDKLEEIIGLRLDKQYALLNMRLPGEGEPEEDFKPHVDLDSVSENLEENKESKLSFKDTLKSFFAKKDKEEAEDDLIDDIPVLPKKKSNTLFVDRSGDVSSELVKEKTSFKDKMLGSPIVTAIKETNDKLLEKLSSEDKEDDRDLKTIVGNQLEKLREKQQEFFDRNKKSIHDKDGDGKREGGMEEYLEKQKEKQKKLKATKEAGGKKGLAAKLGIGGGLFNRNKKDDDDENGFLHSLAGMVLAPIIGSYLGKGKKFAGKMLGKIPGVKSAGKLLSKTKIGKAAALGGGLFGLSKLFGKEGAEEVAEKATKETAESVGKKAAKETAKKAAKETVSKTAAKAAGKKGILSGLKKIPGLGLVIGTGFAASRLARGDLTGAGLEFTSGAISTLPGYGTAASIGMDAALIGRDIYLINKEGKRTSSDIFKGRMKLYGVKPSDDINKLILDLEKYTFKCITKELSPLKRHIKRFAKRFGFNYMDKKQIAFFYTWYSKRFVPLASQYMIILDRSFDKEPDEDTELSVKEQLRVIKELKNCYKREVKIPDDILPTLDAYKAFDKKRNAKNKDSVLNDIDKDIKDEQSPVDKAAMERNKNFTKKVIPFDKDKKRIAALSESFESGGEGSSAVGYDIHGGTSYGKFQLSSKQGTFEEFLIWVQDQPGGLEVAERLRSAGVANTGNRMGKVPQEWKKLVKEGKLGEFEHKFIKETHYDPEYNKLPDDIKQMVDSSKALQSMLWSTSVQHGDQASKIFKKSWKKGSSLPDFIKSVYKERSTRFGSSNKNTQAGVFNRFNNEQEKLLAIVSDEAKRKAIIANQYGLPEGMEAKPNLATKSINTTEVVTRIAKANISNEVMDSDSRDDNNRYSFDRTRSINNKIKQDVDIADKIKEAMPTTITAKDEELHKLTTRQIAELNSINKNISDLNKAIGRSLGNKGLFSQLSANIKGLGEKEINVTVAQQNTNVSMQTPRTNNNTKRDSSIKLDKKRSA